MKTRNLLVYSASAILGISTIVAIIASTQEPVVTTVNVDVLPGSVNLNQEENLSPKVIRVVIGVNNTIRWNNLDDTAHMFTPDRKYDGFSESIGLLMPGESEERTFETPGTFEYHGEPGPWIKGTIIVDEP